MSAESYRLDALNIVRHRTANPRTGRKVVVTSLVEDLAESERLASKLEHHDDAIVFRLAQAIALGHLCPFCGGDDAPRAADYGDGNGRWTCIACDGTRYVIGGRLSFAPGETVRAAARATADVPDATEGEA